MYCIFFLIQVTSELTKNNMILLPALWKETFCAGVRFKLKFIFLVIYELTGGQVKSPYEPTVAHHARVYPRFYSMKRLGLFLLPLAWDADAGPLQDYPQALSWPVPIYTPGWREAFWE